MADRNYWPLVGDVKFDLITCTYDGSDNLTKVEYTLNGDLVLTLDLTYDGSNNLLTVTKS